MIARPESRNEVETIATDFPKPSTILLGDHATETDFKRLPLNRFTTANEYMQELPESVKRMVGSVYTMLMKRGESQESPKRLPQKAANTSEEIAASY